MAILGIAPVLIKRFQCRFHFHSDNGGITGDKPRDSVILFYDPFCAP